MNYEITSTLRGIQRGWLIIDGEKVDGKVCRKCDVMKPISKYTPKFDMYDGTINNCNECMAKRSAEYAKANPEIRRRSERNWREKNPDKVKAMASRSHSKNAEGYRRRLRKWKKENKDKCRVWDQQRRARVNELPVNFDKEWSDLITGIYGGCAVTGINEDLHWDHFIPISAGHGGTTFGNMIPLHSKVNMGKGAKNPLVYFFSGNFEEYRVLDTIAILSFLNDMSTYEYIDYVNNCFKEEDKADVEEIKRKTTLRYRAIDAISANINVC